MAKLYVFDVSFQGNRDERPNLSVTFNVRVQASSRNEALEKAIRSAEVTGWNVQESLSVTRKFPV